MESVPESEREILIVELLRQYRTDPDPAIHGAINWLLKVRWGAGTRVSAADRELITPSPLADRDWFENGQGQTFSIVRGPVEFTMGSTPETDPDRQADEILHKRRISRTFAIGCREVTVAEYSRFLDTKPSGVLDVRQEELFRQYIPTPDYAQGNITWYEVTRYCNWLRCKRECQNLSGAIPRKWRLE